MRAWKRLAVCVTALSAASSATATLLTVNISGQVTTSAGIGSALGSTFVAQYTFDDATSAFALDSQGSAVEYASYAALTSMSFSSGSFSRSLVSGPADVGNNLISIQNSQTTDNIDRLNAKVISGTESLNADFYSLSSTIVNSLALVGAQQAFANSDTRRFNYTNSATGAQIDGTISSVTVSTAAAQPSVPEPATWAMMIGGFGMIGAAMRRQRRASALHG